MKNFQDKVVVITGAGSGIGRALAQLFASRGARLALADLNPETLAQTAALIPTASFTRVLDVADRTAVQAFADGVKEAFGSADLLINNAGVTVAQRAETTSYEDFEWLMGINFWGVVYGTRAFLPLLRASPEAAVVNISSVFGLIAWPSQSAYNAAKFAVRGYTECLRHELAETSVQAICVHPGGIRTNIARDARFYEDDQGNTDAQKFALQFQQLANTSPEQAALKILQGVERKRARILIGADAWLIDRIQRWMPVSYYRVLSRLFAAMRK